MTRPIRYAQVMKRRWRLGRVVFALMLLSIAALAYWIWPGVSWKVAGEKAIGYDVAKRLVYMVKTNEEKHELRGYDLGSGQRQLNLGLDLLVTSEDLNATKKYGKSLIACLWGYVLIPHEQGLIAFNHLSENLELCDLNTGKSLKRIQYAVPSISVMSVSTGVSANGRYLAIMNDVSERVIVWDIETGLRLDLIPGRSDYPGLSGSGFHPNYLHLASNGRHLAYFNSEKTTIHDLTLKSTAFEYPSPCMPRFIEDAQKVVFTPRQIKHGQKPVWYRLTSGSSWQKESTELASGDIECRFVSYTDTLLITDCRNSSNNKRPGWVPVSLWEWGMSHFGFDGTRHYLQFWDLRTGKLTKVFSLYEPSNVFGMAGDLEGRACVSEDGNWLAVENLTEVTVYDVSRHRSVWCWGLVAGLVIIAIRLGWPLKVNMS